MTDSEILQRTIALATMAAMLEAGDRTRNGWAHRAVSPYIDRAAELFDAAENHIGEFGTAPRPNRGA